MFEFSPWPKIPRLNRGMVVTEKIDGTNACVVIQGLSNGLDLECVRSVAGTVVNDGVNTYGIAAQSRNRMVTPTDDNYGFAGWVHRNAQSLVADLGVGYHFGEWWGNGIQRGYGQKEKRFSLFNERRWSDFEFTVPQLGVVPVLHAGVFSTSAIDDAIYDLRLNGSVVAPGYHDAEGVVVYLPAARASFKVMCANDDQAKGQIEAYRREVAA